MTRRAATRERVTYSEAWWCTTCGDGNGAERTKANMVAHLAEVHKLASPIKGSRKMALHLDSADRYVSNYEWRIGPRGVVRAVQSVTGPR